MTVTRSIKNCDFKIFRSEIRPCLVYLFGISFITTLDIYKDYFKGPHKYKDQETYFLYVKLLCLYVIRFYNQVLPDLHCWQSKELCSQQYLYKLLELVTYWNPYKGLVTNWRFMHQRKEGYYNIKSNWVLEQRFNYRLVFRDRSR